MKRKVIAIFVGLVLVGVLGANYERLETFFLGTKQERFNKAVSKHISVDLIGYNLDKTVSIFDSYSGVVDVTIKNVGSDAITGVKGKVFIFDIFMLNGDRHAGNYAIVEENGKPKIYIFDNESIFESVFRVELSPKYDKRDFLRNGTRIIRNPKATIGMKQNMELLEYFLTTSSNYFCKLVVDFYNKLAFDIHSSPIC